MPPAEPGTLLAPEASVTALRSLLLLAIAQTAGCSLAFVDRAPTTPSDQLPITCTTSALAPGTDAVLTALSGALLVAAASSGADGPLIIALSGQTVLTGSSAGFGFLETARCAQLKAARPPTAGSGGRPRRSTEL